MHFVAIVLEFINGLACLLLGTQKVSDPLTSGAKEQASLDRKNLSSLQANLKRESQPGGRMQDTE